MPVVNVNVLCSCHKTLSGETWDNEIFVEPCPNCLELKFGDGFVAGYRMCERANKLQANREDAILRSDANLL